MSVLSKFNKENLDDDVFTGLSPLQEAQAKADRLNSDKALRKHKVEKMSNYRNNDYQNSPLDWARKYEMPEAPLVPEQIRNYFDGAGRSMINSGADYMQNANYMAPVMRVAEAAGEPNPMYDYVPNGIREYASQKGREFIDSAAEYGNGFLEYLRKLGEDPNNPYVYGDVINDKGRERYGWR